MNYSFPRFLCLYAHLLSAYAYGEVLICTYAFNRPEFIELQYKTFKKFLLNEYTFIVFNDAINNDHYQAIHSICNRLNITCYDIPQEIHARPYLSRPESGWFYKYHQPSVRNSNVVQYSLDTLIFNHQDIVMLIDSDMFLIEKLDVRAYMHNTHLAGFIKNCCTDIKPNNHAHTSYLWIGLIFIDMAVFNDTSLFNVNCGFAHGTQLDAGGFTTDYLLTHSQLSIKSIDRVRVEQLACKKCLKKCALFCNHTTQDLCQKGFTQTTISFIQQTPLLHKDNIHRNSEFFLNRSFIHYRAGTNYNTIPQHIINAKTHAFTTFIDTQLTN